MANGNGNGVKAEAPAPKAEVGPVGVLPSKYVQVVAISRSQNVRIGKKLVPAINGPHGKRIGDITAVAVDLTDAKSLRDLQNHLALGSVIIVGNNITLAS